MGGVGAAPLVALLCLLCVLLVRRRRRCAMSAPAAPGLGGTPHPGDPAGAVGPRPPGAVRLVLVSDTHGWHSSLRRPLPATAAAEVAAA
eukprot:gene28663-19078_t